MKKVTIYFNGGVKTVLSEVNVDTVKRLVKWNNGVSTDMFEVTVKGITKCIRKENILFIEVEGV